MLNISTPHMHLNTGTQQTTSIPLKTTMVTKGPATTSQQSGFTFTPTSTPPATATSGSSHYFITF
jgi:hypothetical protein